MTKLVYQYISQTNIALTMANAASSGDTFDNLPKTFVHVENSNVANRTITVKPRIDESAGNKSGVIPLVDLTIVVDASSGGDPGLRVFSIPPAYQSAKGVVKMTYSDSSGLTVAVARVNRQQL